MIWYVAILPSLQDLKCPVAVGALQGSPEPVAPAYSFSKLGNIWKHYEKVGWNGVLITGKSLSFVAGMKKEG